jgi:hypothetical protein
MTTAAIKGGERLKVGRESRLGPDRPIVGGCLPPGPSVKHTTH